MARVAASVPLVGGPLPTRVAKQNSTAAGLPAPMLSNGMRPRYPGNYDSAAPTTTIITVIA